MHLLALFLICGIASMCYGAAFLADLHRRVRVDYATTSLMIKSLQAHDRSLKADIDNAQDAAGRARKAVDAIAQHCEQMAGDAQERVLDLSRAFESHKGSLQAHKKLLPKGRAR